MIVNSTIWGKDVRLFGRDLRVSPSGDIDSVVSLDNLAQAIRHRLTTERGFLPYDPTYGINLALFLGRKNTLEKQEMLKLAIIDALKEESRIQNINSIVITSDPDKPDSLNASVTVTPIISNDNLTLNLIYPWYVTNSILRVEDEETISNSKTSLSVVHDIYSVEGIYLAKGPHYSYNVSTNTLISSTNYYTDNTTFYGKTITLTAPLPITFSTVFVTYSYYATEGINA